jgi:flagellar export protein FliJ
VKQFEFSLDRLLRLKRQMEHVAELEQRRARQAADQARARLEGLRDQLARISDRFASAVGRAMAPQQWASASDLAERLGQSIHEHEQEVARAEQRLTDATQERAQLATEVEAIATLRGQQWEQWRREAAKADQERLDEVGLRQWQNSRAEARPGAGGEPPEPAPAVV